MYPLISASLGISGDDPAESMFEEHIHRFLKGQRIRAIMTRAREATSSSPSISENDRFILLNKRFAKQLPKNIPEFGEGEFMDLIATLTVPASSSKEEIGLDRKTIGSLYQQIMRAVLVELGKSDSVYRKFVQKATKKDVEGWQSLSDLPSGCRYMICGPFYLGCLSRNCSSRNLTEGGRQ